MIIIMEILWFLDLAWRIWYHRIVDLERDLWRWSSSMSLLKQGHIEPIAQIMSKWILNISKILPLQVVNSLNIRFIPVGFIPVMILSCQLFLFLCSVMISLVKLQNVWFKKKNKKKIKKILVVSIWRIISGEKMNQHFFSLLQPAVIK